MKALNSYIVEKLRINKSTNNSESDYNTIIALITDIIGLNLEKPENKDYIDAIENWVRENDLTEFRKDVICCGYYQKLKSTNDYDRLKDKDLLKFVSDNADIITNQIDRIYKENIKPTVDKDNRIIYIFDKFLLYSSTKWPNIKDFLFVKL